MKKHIILSLYIFILSCNTLPAFRNARFTNFEIEYTKPVYYKLGEKIYYSKDINISSDDKLICTNCYRGGHISPDYNYIVVHGEKAVILYDKNGSKIKEFKNYYFDLIQWGPKSKQILILKKVNNKVQLVLYNVLTGLEKIIIRNFLKDKRSQFYIWLNSSKISRYLFNYIDTLRYQKVLKFYFSKDGKNVYLIDLNFIVNIYNIKKSTKSYLLNIRPIYYKIIKSFLNYRELKRKYNHFINDLFIYYYSFAFTYNSLNFFLSYNFEKQIFYNELHEIKTGFWLHVVRNFINLINLKNAIGYMPHPAPPTYNTYFLPGNRYFIMPLYLKKYSGYIVYDTKKYIYKELLGKKDFKKVKKYFEDEMYPETFYYYFSYLFPVTSYDVPISIRFMLDNKFLYKKWKKIDKTFRKKYNIN